MLLFENEKDIYLYIFSYTKKQKKIKKNLNFTGSSNLKKTINNNNLGGLDASRVPLCGRKFKYI